MRISFYCLFPLLLILTSCNLLNLRPNYKAEDVKGLWKLAWVECEKGEMIESGHKLNSALKSGLSKNLMEFTDKKVIFTIKGSYSETDKESTCTIESVNDYQIFWNVVRFSNSKIKRTGTGNYHKCNGDMEDNEPRHHDFGIFGDKLKMVFSKRNKPSLNGHEQPSFCASGKEAAVFVRENSKK